MKKTVICPLIGLAAGVVLLLVAVPSVLPPLAKGFMEAKLTELGFPARVQIDLGYTWNNGPKLAGSLCLNLQDSPVEAHATFGVGLGTWHARLTIPSAELTESDPTVRRMLTEHPLPKGFSNLTFRASLSIEASAERTWRRSVSVWSAKAPIRVFSAAVIRDDKPIVVTGLSITPGASGIADHLDIAPMFLRTTTVTINGFALTNLTASIRATEKALLVTEASAGLCGGRVSFYSLFLNPKTLNAGFTLFMDDVEAGEILRHFNGFSGEASGRLHGKTRLFLREGGKALRLGNAFLYSTPGETGKLKLTDASTFTENLALAGVDEASRRNVASALTDLDYSVLKLNLKRLTGEDATLGIQLTGTATRGALSVPVNLNLNFNGKLEHLLNTGLNLSNQLKGKKK